ncbi:hypothetical protein Esti_005403 [Eimeria stiedai]
MTLQQRRAGVKASDRSSFQLRFFTNYLPLIIFLLSSPPISRLVSAALPFPRPSQPRPRVERGQQLWSGAEEETETLLFEEWGAAAWTPPGRAAALPCQHSKRRASLSSSTCLLLLSRLRRAFRQLRSQLLPSSAGDVRRLSDEHRGWPLVPGECSSVTSDGSDEEENGSSSSLTSVTSDSSSSSGISSTSSFSSSTSSASLSSLGAVSGGAPRPKLRPPPGFPPLPPSHPWGGNSISSPFFLDPWAATAVEDAASLALAAAPKAAAGMGAVSSRGESLLPLPGGAQQQGAAQPLATVQPVTSGPVAPSSTSTSSASGLGGAAAPTPTQQVVMPLPQQQQQQQQPVSASLPATATWGGPRLSEEELRNKVKAALRDSFLRKRALTTVGKPPKRKVGALEKQGLPQRRSSSSSSSTSSSRNSSGERNPRTAHGASGSVSPPSSRFASSAVAAAGRRRVSSQQQQRQQQAAASPRVSRGGPAAASGSVQSKVESNSNEQQRQQQAAASPPVSRGGPAAASGSVQSKVESNSNEERRRLGGPWRWSTQRTWKKRRGLSPSSTTTPSASPPLKRFSLLQIGTEPRGSHLDKSNGSSRRASPSSSPSTSLFNRDSLLLPSIGPLQGDQAAETRSPRRRSPPSSSIFFGMPLGEPEPTEGERQQQEQQQQQQRRHQPTQ